MDNNDDADVIYLDFCKAFGKVPHTRVLRNYMHMESAAKFTCGSKNSCQEKDSEL